ncbi:MAG: hypothetical protein R3D57_18925 [Hyphomicrobiaceae bacterium]
MTEDALVGLRFEVGGGLGRTTGRIVGKAGPLYLVHKTEATHMELLTLDDLRSAKFYPDPETTPVPDASPVPERRLRLSEHIRRTVNPRRE